SAPPYLLPSVSLCLLPPASSCLPPPARRSCPPPRRQAVPRQPGRQAQKQPRTPARRQAPLRPVPVSTRHHRKTASFAPGLFACLGPAPRLGPDAWTDAKCAGARPPPCQSLDGLNQSGPRGRRPGVGSLFDP